MDMVEEFDSHEVCVSLLHYEPADFLSELCLTGKKWCSV